MTTRTSILPFLILLLLYQQHEQCSKQIMVNATRTSTSFQHPSQRSKTSLSNTRLNMINNNGGGGGGLDKGFNILETASKFLPQGSIVKTAKEGWKFAWKRMMTELAPQDKSGMYQRQSYNFGKSSDRKRGWIGIDPNFPDEAGRYHVYVGNPCPWCHRVRLALSLRSIQTTELSTTLLIDDPVRASRGGWVIDSTSTSSSSSDPLFDATDLREVYDRLSPDGTTYKGRCTAPLLVDKKQKKVVSNESRDIVRMINSMTFGHDDSNKKRMDLRPNDLIPMIDDTNDWVYNLLNNGVYRCGFSTTQQSYDRASSDVRMGLSRVDDILSQSPFLCGDVFTESDLYLLPTVLRFDGAYGPLFRAGGGYVRVRDYEGIRKWLGRCWRDVKGVRDTIDLGDATGSYYRQLFPLNPGGLIPSPGFTEDDLGLD